MLQGGGALGAYQAGVFEGLPEAGIEPDWVAGVSIGAINAALIAGNRARAPARAPARVLGDRVSRPLLSPATGRCWRMSTEMGARDAQGARLVRSLARDVEGQRGFFVPRGRRRRWWADAHDRHGQFYDTTPLKGTLERLVDFDRINPARCG